jgi:phosphoglycerate-specific signal transduction histidine kinase
MSSSEDRSPGEEVFHVIDKDYQQLNGSMNKLKNLILSVSSEKLKKTQEEERIKKITWFYTKQKEEIVADVNKQLTVLTNQLTEMMVTLRIKYNLCTPTANTVKNSEDFLESFKLVDRKMSETAEQVDYLLENLLSEFKAIDAAMTRELETINKTHNIGK